MQPKKFDAIVIGSGLGGLSCGAYLAKNGRKVLILEKHSMPGGYATNFRRGDFVFDSTLHMVDGVGKGQTMRKFLEQCNVAEKIEYLKLKHFARLIFPEHDIRLPCGDLEGVIAVLEKNFPLEKERIRRLFKKLVKIHDDIFRFVLSSAPMWQQLPVFPFRYRALFPALKKTVGELLGKHLNDDKLKALLWANWGFFGLPISKLNVVSVFANIDYWMLGAYYPKGGSQMVSNAFVDVIEQDGGEVVLNTEVASIIVESGEAVGVMTKKGEKYLAKNIISNACAIDTFNSLVGREKLPPKFVAKMDRMEPCVSVLSVHLGLDEDFRSTLKDNEDYEIIVSDTYDPDRDYQWCINCDVEHASFFLTLYSNIEDTFAKDNKFVIGITQGQNYDYWEKYEKDYFAGNKKSTTKRKKELPDY